MRFISLLVILFLTACQSRPGTGGFYVYTDAQGNLVTVDETSDNPEPTQDRNLQTASQNAPDGKSVSNDVLDSYRPSGEVDKEMEAKERDRFITYVDETGQLVSRPMDMVAEKEAAGTRPPLYESLKPGAYLETYRSLRADCCLHMLEVADTLNKGGEVLVKFGQDSPVLMGEIPYRAMVLELDAEVSSVVLKAFIKKQSYLAVQLLWLDAKGFPTLLIDQPFSRKYPENWYRYGYLQGTLEPKSGQRYLVVFLPYLKGVPGTDGLRKEIKGELLLSAS